MLNYQKYNNIYFVYYIFYKILNFKNIKANYKYLQLSSKHNYFHHNEKEMQDLKKIERYDNHQPLMHLIMKNI